MLRRKEERQLFRIQAGEKIRHGAEYSEAPESLSVALQHTL